MGVLLEVRSQDVRRDRLDRPLMECTQLVQIGLIGATGVWRMIGMSQVRKKGGDQSLQGWLFG